MPANKLYKCNESRRKGMNWVNVIFTALFFVASCLYAQKTVVLQQGVDGYQGCDNAQLLSETSGNRKYTSNFAGDFISAAHYKC